MSTLLRALLALSVTSLLLVGCGEKEAAPVEAAPAVEAPAATPAPAEAAPAPAPAAAEPGGYEPTPEERVPGITIDDSAQPVTEATAPAEASATEAAAEAK